MADDKVSFLRQAIVVKIHVWMIFIQAIGPESQTVPELMRKEATVCHAVGVDFYVAILPWLCCQGAVVTNCVFADSVTLWTWQCPE